MLFFLLVLVFWFCFGVCLFVCFTFDLKLRSIVAEIAGKFVLKANKRIAG